MFIQYNNLRQILHQVNNNNARVKFTFTQLSQSIQKLPLIITFDVLVVFGCVYDYNNYISIPRSQTYTV